MIRYHNWSKEYKYERWKQAMIAKNERNKAKEQKCSTVDRSTDGRRPVDTRPGNFRRRVEKQSRPFDRCPETIFLCFSPFIPKQIRSQKVQGNPNNNKQATESTIKPTKVRIQYSQVQEHTWCKKLNESKLDDYQLGDKIPQYKQTQQGNMQIRAK